MEKIKNNNLNNKIRHIEIQILNTEGDIKQSETCLDHIKFLEDQAGKLDLDIVVFDQQLKGLNAEKIELQNKEDFEKLKSCPSKITMDGQKGIVAMYTSLREMVDEQISQIESLIDQCMSKRARCNTKNIAVEKEFHSEKIKKLKDKLAKLNAEKAKLEELKASESVASVDDGAEIK